ATRETVKAGIAQAWTTTTHTVGNWLHGNSSADSANQTSSSSFASSTTSQATSRSASTPAGATPALNIVKGRHLKRTYYYHFDANLPQ
ncbi:peptidase M10, partial [Lactobacillus crispatus]|nr:peptidase M10 [Lactobacillus crispatus]